MPASTAQTQPLRIAEVITARRICLQVVSLKLVLTGQPQRRPLNTASAGVTLEESLV